MVNAAPVTAPQLVKQLTRLHATLSRYDTALATWQDQGHTYPSIDVSRDFASMARSLDDARTGLRSLHPEATALDKRLQGDVLEIARDGGNLWNMSQHTQVFGSGWSRALDAPITDVQAAIDLLLGSSAKTA